MSPGLAHRVLQRQRGIVAKSAFTASNGTNLDAYTGEVGPQWVKASYAGAVLMQIGSNRVYHNSGGGVGWYYVPALPAGPSVVVSADFVQLSALSGSGAGIGARFSTTAASGYTLRFGVTTTWAVHQYTSGGPTLLGSLSQAAGHGELRCFGNQIAAYIDGTLALGPYTDNTWKGTGVPMLFSTGGGSTSTGIAVDNFLAIAV